MSIVFPDLPSNGGPRRRARAGRATEVPLGFATLKERALSDVLKLPAVIAQSMAPSNAALQRGSAPAECSGAP